MATLLTSRARAWMYCGDWVADCPRDGCTNVEFLFDLVNKRNPRSARTARKVTFHCSYCNQIAAIEWAADEAEITTVLQLRPIPSNRNWFPVGHELALRSGLPHGQSVSDLIDENREHGVT